MYTSLSTWDAFPTSAWDHHQPINLWNLHRWDCQIHVLCSWSKGKLEIMWGLLVGGELKGPHKEFSLISCALPLFQDKKQAFFGFIEQWGFCPEVKIALTKSNSTRVWIQAVWLFVNLLFSSRGFIRLPRYASSINTVYFLKHVGANVSFCWFNLCQKVCFFLSDLGPLPFLCEAWGSSSHCNFYTFHVSVLHHMQYLQLSETFQIIITANKTVFCATSCKLYIQKPTMVTIGPL